MLRSESGGEDPIYTLSTQAQNLPTRDSLETLIKDITWSAHQKKNLYKYIYMQMSAWTSEDSLTYQDVL